MNRKTGRALRLGVLAALPLGVAVAAWAAGGRKLVMNGRTVSTRVQTIQGQAYVPLADVAKAQGMVVVPIAGGYEIRKAGGAHPISGLRGKVGDVLFDGKWRFQVLSVNTVDSYTMQHHATNDYGTYHDVVDFEDKVVRPKEGRNLIAIKCRVTNGRNSTQSLWVYNNDTHTALADSQGESYPPAIYDLEETGSFDSKKLLPGAKLDFTVLFSVPEGTHLKDLVFTLRTLSDKGSDVRVTLN
jgi:hypothetical protein